MFIDAKEYLAHYGTPRKSGRYPWGSGGTPMQSHRTFVDHIQDLRRQGLSDTEIAQGLDISTTEFRDLRTIAKNALKQAEITEAYQLKFNRGMSNVAIGEKMGKSESYVRSLLAEGEKEKADVLNATTAMLKAQVAEKGLVDVGSGNEYLIGVTTKQLSTALTSLQQDGYAVHTVPVLQLGTGQNTSTKVLAPPDTTWGEIMKRRNEIQSIAKYSDDDGMTYHGTQPPLAINPKRVGVNYHETGGSLADGVIYVRPGVPDVSLGDARYAQVRVSVGKDHYLKGMAMYKDDLPEGVDLLFNTNKSDTGNKLDAMKPVVRDKDGNVDPVNPYGAIIKPGGQILSKDRNGNTKVTSAMNKVYEEGDWEKWSRTISPQMLSKQSPLLARTQLKTTYEKRIKEFEEISALTNPTVRRKLLEEFADGTDSAAVHMKAAPFRNQGTHAILPIKSLPETQVFAPNFEDGTRVVLIRFPHGGTFEIPELTVNNKHRESNKLLKGARDAIGINPLVAERLSGADFDGDTVLVIPNNANRIKSTPALEGLKDFNPRREYKGYPGMKVMSNTQTEMGKVSNLITDMTIRGAPASELVRAVRHSMVVIDAERHKLNYKLSAERNGIAQLKSKYQTAGASTLISRAKARTDVLDRKERPAALGGRVNRETGKLEFVETGARNFKTGELKTIRSQKLKETDDAHTLSSGTPMERVYADHSNRLKDLANRARLDAINTPPSKYNESAFKAYRSQVDSLNSKLALASRNAPLERRAQVIANTTLAAKRAAYPDMDKAQEKKEKARALTEARNRMGAGKERIVITDDEWAAIQAGAVSNDKLSRILRNADMDVVKQHARPRQELLMTPTMNTRARQMLASGFTRAQVAAQLGVSLSTLDTATDDTAAHSAIDDDTDDVDLSPIDEEDDDDEEIDVDDS